MSNNTQNTRQAPRIQDLNKFTMYASVPGVENQRSRLIWSLRGDSPRITVFTFNPATNRNENISIMLQPDVFMYFTEELERIADAAPNTKRKIEMHVGLRDAANKLTGEKRLVSELWFGVDNEGMVWLSIIEGDKPKIKFNFSVWEYYKILKADGSQLSETEGSVNMAKSTARALRSIYATALSSFSSANVQNNTTNTSVQQNNTFTKADSDMLEDLNF